MQKPNVWTPEGESGGGSGGDGVMNWEIGIDMYTLMCIKWITNNLMYKKIKLKKRQGHSDQSTHPKPTLYFLAF